MWWIGTLAKRIEGDSTSRREEISNVHGANFIFIQLIFDLEYITYFSNSTSP